MNNPIDIETVVARRKQVWIKNAKTTISIQERIATSVPWWLIIVATGLFALSASHTAGVFSQLSNIGYAGPFVVEFALLWAAFARVNAKQDHLGISLALRGLEILVFFMAIGANTIGATSRVAMLSGIDSFSFSEIITRYGALPITTQAEILFVLPFGVFIPIGTWVVGEGLAELFLKQRRSGGLLEQKWHEVEREELRRAFYAELISRGMPSIDARRESEKLAAGLTGNAQRTLQGSETVIQLNSPKTLAADRPKTIQPAIQLNSSEYSKRAPRMNKMGPSARIIEYLDEHPNAINEISQNQLAKMLGVSVGTVNAVFKMKRDEALRNEQGDSQ
jgi:hypothetical protein